MTRPQLIIDCETTGLVPNYSDGSGVIWEIAIIERGTGCEWLWRMEPDTALADPKALEVGRFAERTAGMRYATRDEVRARYGGIPASGRMTGVWDLTWSGNGRFWSDPADLALVLARSFLRDVTLIGAVPSFDAGFLSAFLVAHGENPQPWHYRLRDIGSMAAGWLACAVSEGTYDSTLPLDAGTDDYALKLGIDLSRFDRHTALGDCRLDAAILNVIEGGAR